MSQSQNAESVHTTRQHKGHHTVTTEGIGRSREHQLTHQLTCRTGSVVDVTATAVPVTSTISASTC